MYKNLQKYLSNSTTAINNYSDYLVYLLTGLFILAGSLVSVHRFWQYEVFYYDFGIFDQAIWRVSQLRAPIIDHLIVGGKWIFADHFSPSIFLFSPLYWFTNKSEVLLIAQAIIVGLSGIVLYRIGITVLKNNLLSLSVVLSYFLFVGLQNAIISDFHEVTVSTLPLMLLFWAFVKKRVCLYFLFFIITLGFKESLFILGVGIGVTVIALNHAWWKIGIITIVISIVWGFVAIKLIIPFFSEGMYQYAASISSNPIKLITAFFDSEVKRNTLWYSFLQFGFLPLLSPAFWFLVVQDFFIRFYPDWHTRWGLGLHYSAQVSVILAFATIYGYSRLEKIKQVKPYISLFALLIVVNAFYLYSFKLRGPLALAYNRAFYQHSNDLAFLDTLITKIPRDVSVMTQNNLAVRFTHQDVYLLRLNYKSIKPEYVVLDMREGQSPNNYFGGDDINVVFAYLKKDTQYKIIYNTDEQFIFRRRK